MSRWGRYQNKALAGMMRNRPPPEEWTVSHWKRMTSLPRHHLFVRGMLDAQLTEEGTPTSHRPAPSNPFEYTHEEIAFYDAGHAYATTLIAKGVRY